MPPPAETCKTCKYWIMISNKMGGCCGYCRRLPPPRTERPEKTQDEHVIYPTVHEDEWCGEYVKV